jgi:hypothetical protein
MAVITSHQDAINHPKHPKVMRIITAAGITQSHKNIENVQNKQGWGRMISELTSMETMRAWPRCREPVTLGGGMTMVNCSASLLSSGLK